MNCIFDSLGDFLLAKGKVENGECNQMFNQIFNQMFNQMFNQFNQMQHPLPHLFPLHVFHAFTHLRFISM